MRSKELVALITAADPDGALDVELGMDGEVWGVDGVEIDVRADADAGVSIEDPDVPTYSVLLIVGDG